MTDMDGTVRIAARKGDLTVTDDNGTRHSGAGSGNHARRAIPAARSIRQQQEEEYKKRAAGAAPAAGGGVLNSPVAIGMGAAAIGGVTTWVLLKNDNPVSPSTPQ